MQCFSCFSNIHETYNFYWYPLEYCSKCNLIAVKIDKLDSFIDFSIKLFMNIETNKDSLVYEYVRKNMLNKLKLNGRIYDNRICHSQCSILYNEDNGFCRYRFINDKKLNIFYCFLINKIMFNPENFKECIKNYIKKGYKKWFLWEKIKHILRRDQNVI